MRRMIILLSQALSVLAVVVSTLLMAGMAWAGEPPAQPMLRVETGMHTTLIRRMAVDAPRNRLITASDDKTVRVWQLPDARLLATLRVPMDEAHEGQLFALAVSPDGRTLAVGGWTGWDWDGKGSVYLFDIASGDLTRRLEGFADAISALAWSPDGNTLAVGLQGRAGLVVVRADNGERVAADDKYRDKLTDLDFDTQGRLVSVAVDGMVRVYDQHFQLLARRIPPGGRKPVAVKFSPQGDVLAVGFHDAPAVAVLSARDLSLVRQAEGADAGAGKGQINLMTVVWSSDGQSLYAAGDFRGEGLNPVFRWRNRGAGSPERIPIAANRIPEIQSMPGGRIAFVAEDPAFGVIDPEGHIEAFRGPDIHDFSQAHGQLEVSADGTLVRYPVAGIAGKHAFSALMAGDQSPGASRIEASAPPRLSGDAVRIDGWQNGYQPLINGKLPALDDYEMGRSYAFAPDGKSVLLGTEWALRLLDGEAREIWSVKLAAVARAVNVSANGKAAVAALSDGTLRWYDMASGKEQFAYFPHRNGQDWVAWLPSGYYISSTQGDNYVGWHVNHGKRDAPDFFRAVQFDRILYRPDVFLDAVQVALKPANPRTVVKVKEGSGFDITRMSEIAPPRLRLHAAGISRQDGEVRAHFKLIGTGGGKPAKDMAIFVNGIPVTPASERAIETEESGHFQREIMVTLSAQENVVRAESFNGMSMGVAEAYIHLPDAVRGEAKPGELYMLAVGVNDFPDLSADASLAYAARDAESMASAVSRPGATRFAKVHVKTINDHTKAKPERKTIIDALRFIQQAKAGDTVAIFLASHGISDPAGNYYFVPRDAIAADLEKLEAGGKVESLIPWTVFFDVLRATPGRRLLIVDTCQARNMEGRFESHSLMKRSAASQFSLMLASKGDEESQEHPVAKHGLFTYALLDAMRKPADSDNDGKLTVREWFALASRVVDSERDKKVGPQTPQLLMPPALDSMSLIQMN